MGNGEGNLRKPDAEGHADLRLGVLDGRYELLAVLGRGGAGQLYRGRHLRTGRGVAIKLLHPGTANRSVAQQRFEREAQFASELCHPNVVEILDFGEAADGQPYLVMELLRGRSLADTLREDGPMRLARALELLLPIAGALAVAHDRGMLHRDVKPGNLFLAQQPGGSSFPKLLDFGIAKLLGGGEALTAPGHVVGTPGFMSPEQLHGVPLTPASDQWSFAAVMQTCLTGVPPDRAEDAGDAISRLRSASSEARSLLAVIERALRDDPSARFPDMRQLARALLSVAYHAGVAVPQDPDPVGLPDWRSWLSALAAEDATCAPSQAQPLEAAPASAPLGEGSVLAERFVLRRPLGRGAMGVVYEAQNLQIQRPCAIKVLHPLLASDQELRERFRKEAQRAGRIVHEHVVAVTDYDVDGSTPFLVMERLHGESLRQLLDRVGALPVERAVQLSLQMCRGLAAAHELGVVHRDLKPQNVFVTRRADGSDWIKILDFGVAKALRGDGSEVSTQAGALIGTVRYMAPEQIRSAADVTERCDIYSLGLILYEMLAGRPAFDAHELPATIHQVLHSTPAPLESLRDDLPRSLLDVVERATRREAENRTASATTLEAELQRALDPHAELSPRVGPSPRKQAARRAPLLLGLLFVASLIAAAAWFMGKNTSDPRGKDTASQTERTAPTPLVNTSDTSAPSRAAAHEMDQEQVAAETQAFPAAEALPSDRGSASKAKSLPSGTASKRGSQKRPALQFDNRNPYR